MTEAEIGRKKSGNAAIRRGTGVATVRVPVPR